jgi:Tol biopolymer transport system component
MKKSKFTEEQIAFASDRDSTLNIWIISSNIGDPSATQFTFKEGRAPAWSPARNWVAFESNKLNKKDMLFTLRILNLRRSFS